MTSADLIKQGGDPQGYHEHCNVNLSDFTHLAQVQLPDNMGYFWGRRKNDPDRPEEASHVQDENRNESAPTPHEEPTERTTLLPRDNVQGYLSPDDPAVGRPSSRECRSRAN